MGIQSKIEWTEHTLNPWQGCEKVHAGCKNCYAEAMDYRYEKGKHWGPRSVRKFRKNWKKNLRAFARAADRDQEKDRHRVFVASMCDFFEDSRPLDTGGTTEEVRSELLNMVHDYPQLSFLFLTKRPQNISKMVPEWWSWKYEDGCPPNVWFGASISNQMTAKAMIPALLKSPGWENKFLSIEPLLGPLNLVEVQDKGTNNAGEKIANDLFGRFLRIRKGSICYRSESSSLISWVICGGESGPNARPMHPLWAESLQKNCKSAEVPFFFKQWGTWAPGRIYGRKNICITITGELYAEEESRELKPESIKQLCDPYLMHKTTKQAAGRDLRGAQCIEYPSILTHNPD